jgi:hypothetical protein
MKVVFEDPVRRRRLVTDVLQGIKDMLRQRGLLALLLLRVGCLFEFALSNLE